MVLLYMSLTQEKNERIRPKFCHITIGSFYFSVIFTWELRSDIVCVRRHSKYCVVENFYSVAEFAVLLIGLLAPAMEQRIRVSGCDKQKRFCSDSSTVSLE